MTPLEWSQFYKIVILDPDGWRGTMRKDFNEPIDRKEFLQRCFMSTLANVSDELLKEF